MMSNSTSNNKLKIFIIVCVVVFLTGLVATLTGPASMDGVTWTNYREAGTGDWHIYEGSGEQATYTLKRNDAKFDAMDLNLASAM
jgi:hypothetical protein